MPSDPSFPADVTDAFERFSRSLVSFKEERKRHEDKVSRYLNILHRAESEGLPIYATYTSSAMYDSFPDGELTKKEERVPGVNVLIRNIFPCQAQSILYLSRIDDGGYVSNRADVVKGLENFEVLRPLRSLGNTALRRVVN